MNLKPFIFFLPVKPAGYPYVLRTKDNSIYVSNFVTLIFNECH